MDVTARVGLGDQLFRNVTLTGLLSESITDNITANAGGGQAGAVQLTAEVNRITTVATAGDSVKLPEATQGLTVIVVNHGANALQVFGLGDDTINDVAAATGVSQMVGSVVLYVCTTGDGWYTEGLSSGFTGGLQTFSFADALAANSGGVQAGATAITTLVARFTTVAGAGYSAVLPAAAGGLEITVINAAAANAMKIFPAGTDAIDGLGASSALLVAAGTVVTFYCTVAGQWHTMLYQQNSIQQAYSTNAGAGAVSLAAADIYGGTVEHTLNMTSIGGNSAWTLPTVANLVAAIPNIRAGNTYKLKILNTGGAFTGTVTTATGWTLNGTMTIAQNTCREFYVTFTSLTAASLQSIGSYTITAI